MRARWAVAEPWECGIGGFARSGKSLDYSAKLRVREERQTNANRLRGVPAWLGEVIGRSEMSRDAARCVFTVTQREGRRFNGSPDSRKEGDGNLMRRFTLAFVTPLQP